MPPCRCPAFAIPWLLARIFGQRAERVSTAEAERVPCVGAEHMHAEHMVRQVPGGGQMATMGRWATRMLLSPRLDACKLYENKFFYI